MVWTSKGCAPYIKLNSSCLLVKRHNTYTYLLSLRRAVITHCNSPIVFSVNQILAKQSTDSKFKAEANLKAKVSKPKQSSIAMDDIHVHTNVKA